jgi:hypothetical protein
MYIYFILILVAIITWEKVPIYCNNDLICREDISCQDDVECLCIDDYCEFT